ncbi:MAG: tRNA pseudouridine(55) synthase TruB [Streptococcaceae bacterium]|jgi:tRNA pseudouridine55 synthase|nr:tRNA pseudouridine(55) synthase TruB [Streptococcaceae bacterium]
MEGILNIYKEKGYTSFDVCAKLRGILGTKKIGHGGTLDPQVEGVLPIAVGKATRLLEYMEASGKEYIGEVTIGIATETEDAEGAIVETKTVARDLSEVAVDKAMASFVGVIAQVPPMYSAVKIKGKRLYEYARQGLVIDRPAREVEIKAFERTSDITFVENTAKFSFRVACGKGTYVRTLAVDLARKLGYPGHMSQLTRTMANGLRIENAVKVAEVQVGNFNLLPLSSAVVDLPRVDVSEEERMEISFGRDVFFAEHSEEILAAFFEDKLIAILEKRVEACYKPKKVLD